MICPICHNNFKTKTTLNCSHSFCVYCINKWHSILNTCPICRKTFSTYEIIENIARVKTRQDTREYRRLNINKELDILSKKINDNFYSQERNKLYIPDSCSKDIFNYFKKLYNNRDTYNYCDIPFNGFVLGNVCTNLSWSCKICKYKKKIKKYLYSLKNIYKWEQSKEWLFKFEEVGFFQEK